MRFKQHYSGSAGNLYEVTANNGERLLVDPGVTIKKLRRALGSNLRNIAGCLASHSHLDHCKSLIHMMSAGIETYALQETYNALGVIEGRRVNPIICGVLIKIGCFQVLPFETNHDTEKSCGFVIMAGGEYLLFVTDSSHIEQMFKYQFSIIAIECSYSMSTLQKNVDDGIINEALASRLLTSHQEKSTAIQWILDYNLYLKERKLESKLREIHLLHMSARNINKKNTRDDFEKRFMITTKIVGGK